MFFKECVYFLKLPIKFTQIILSLGLRKGAWKHGTGRIKLSDETVFCFKRKLVIVDDFEKYMRRKKH